MDVDALLLEMIQVRAKLIHGGEHLTRLELLELERDTSDRVIFVDQPSNEQRIILDGGDKLGCFLFGDRLALYDGARLQLCGERGADFRDASWKPIGIAFDDILQGVEGVVLEVALGVLFVGFVKRVQRV